MTREPETLIDKMVQAVMEGRRITPIEREVLHRALRRSVRPAEAFGHQSPEQDHAAFMAADSGPVGFPEIELPADCERKD